MASPTQNEFNNSADSAEWRQRTLDEISKGNKFNKTISDLHENAVKVFATLESMSLEEQNNVLKKLLQDTFENGLSQLQSQFVAVKAQSASNQTFLKGKVSGAIETASKTAAAVAKVTNEQMVMAGLHFASANQIQQSPFGQQQQLTSSAYPLTFASGPPQQSKQKMSAEQFAQYASTKTCNKNCVGEARLKCKFMHALPN